MFQREIEMMGKSLRYVLMQRACQARSCGRKWCSIIWRKTTFLTLTNWLAKSIECGDVMIIKSQLEHIDVSDTTWTPWENPIQSCGQDVFRGCKKTSCFRASRFAHSTITRIPPCLPNDGIKMNIFFLMLVSTNNDSCLTRAHSQDKRTHA